VPKYRFHISDGVRELSDGKGSEFTGLRAARAHAAVVLRDAKAMLCEKEVRDLSGWSVRVTDARGRTVFTLEFDPRERAMPPMERGGHGAVGPSGPFVATE
jgi:hypothetical protein